MSEPLLTLVWIIGRIVLAGFLLVIAFEYLFPWVRLRYRINAAVCVIGAVGFLAGAWELGR